MNGAEVRSIIQTYAKHGWSLRRVLLSESSEVDAGIFKDVSVTRSDLDAMWFSRKSRDGIAWEIRHIGAAPLAYLTIVADDAADENEALADTESRLRQALARREKPRTSNA